MTRNTPDPAVDEWLPLEQASVYLGVHPSTLRRWANSGSIAVFVTPGGHRRFRRTDLERFEREGREGRGSRLPVQWTDQAIAQAREGMARSRIFTVFDDEERQAQRAVGRRLLGLVLQFAGTRGEDEDLLEEAAAIGETYARLSLNHQQPLVDLLRAIGLFRDAFLEAAVLHHGGAASSSAADSGRLMLRIGRLLDEVQIGAVRKYESGPRV